MINFVIDHFLAKNMHNYIYVVYVAERLIEL